MPSCEMEGLLPAEQREEAEGWGKLVWKEKRGVVEGALGRRNVCAGGNADEEISYIGGSRI